MIAMVLQFLDKILQFVAFLQAANCCYIFIAISYNIGFVFLLRLFSLTIKQSVLCNN